MLTERNRKAVDVVSGFLNLKPVAFIGSGLTQPDYPGWTKLLKMLGTDLGLQIDEKQTPIAQAQALCNAKRAEYMALLIKYFKDVPATCRQGLRDLVKLDLSACVTTNFDYSVYRALWELGSKPEHYFYPYIQVSDCQFPRTLFFLHGGVREGKIDDLDNFVLHEAAYRRAYSGDGVQPGKVLSILYDLFNYHDVLFVGYSADKSEPMRVAMEHSKKRKITSRRRLLLVPAARAAEEIELMHLKFGVEVVEYDPVDDLHSGLDEILAELSQRRVPPAPGQGNKPFEGLDLNGIVG